MLNFNYVIIGLDAKACHWTASNHHDVFRPFSSDQATLWQVQTLATPGRSKRGDVIL